MDDKTDTIKIVFLITPDEDGYPGIDAERMWAKPIGVNQYRIDNIPIYVYGISAGDIVSAKLEEDGDYYFDELIETSKNTTIRILFPKDKSTPELIQETMGKLASLGCKYEMEHSNFFAVNVPPEVNYKSVLNILDQGVKEGTIAYEDGSIRHLTNE